MRVHSSTRYAAIAVLVGALACAGNTAREADTEPDQAAAPRDTVSDTLGGEAQAPPGYRGMERDTAMVPQTEQTPTDTFLQRQGQGYPQDTAGYGGLERPDTTGQAGQGEQGWTDTTGAAGARDTSGAWGTDTTGAGQGGDTTGYNPSQQPSQDTTSNR